MINPASFAHSQTQSKIWLCEQLEPYLPDKSIVAVLGCWNNLQGYMLALRNKHKYQHILGLDIDSEAIIGADKLCEGFMLGADSIIRNEVADVNYYNLNGYNILINCSVEHMTNEWFNNADPNAIICIQTSTVVEQGEPWYISNPTTTFEEFEEKFPLSNIMFAGVTSFDYGNLQYDRFMLIGKK